MVAHTSVVTSGKYVSLTGAVRSSLQLELSDSGERPERCRPVGGAILWFNMIVIKKDTLGDEVRQFEIESCLRYTQVMFDARATGEI